MSVLFAWEHFLRKNNRVFISNNGKKVLSRNLTGTKVSKFFHNEGEISTPFNTWKDVFSLSVSPSNIPEQERIHKLEQIAIEKLRKQIGDGGRTYPIRARNVFGGTDDMGGVPDGEQIEGDKVVSIIEMSFSSQHAKDRDEPHGSKVLQLSLYLFLRNIEVGYVFVCPTHKFQTDFNLSDNVKRGLHTNPKPTIIKASNVDQIKDLSFGYEILESGEGSDEEEKHICSLYKIKIRKDECEELFAPMNKWMEEHQNYSPQLMPNEGKAVISDDFLGDVRRLSVIDE